MKQETIRKNIKILMVIRGETYRALAERYSVRRQSVEQRYHRTITLNCVEWWGVALNVEPGILLSESIIEVVTHAVGREND